MNKNLEEIGKAIFKHWFVDFEFPNEEGKPYRSSGGKMVYNEELGREIPEGWTVVPLSEVTTTITKGTTPTKNEVTNSKGEAQVNYIRVKDITEEGEIFVDKHASIPESVHLGVLKRSILSEGDVLYTIAGTIGRIAVVDKSILPANTNQAIAIIRPKSNIPSNFLVLTMFQSEFRRKLHSNVVHAVQANLSLGMLSKSRLIIPLIDSLPSIFEPIDKIMQRINTNRSESHTLGLLRDILLPKLISGKIRVPVEA
jgi:type I restriction enzyme S subunit